MKVLYGLTIAIAFVVTSPGRDSSREKAAFSGGTGDCFWGGTGVVDCNGLVDGCSFGSIELRSVIYTGNGDYRENGTTIPINNCFGTGGCIVGEIVDVETCDGGGGY